MSGWGRSSHVATKRRRHAREERLLLVRAFHALRERVGAGGLLTDAGGLVADASMT